MALAPARQAFSPGACGQQWGTAVNCRLARESVGLLPPRERASRRAGRASLHGVWLHLPRGLAAGARAAARQCRSAGGGGRAVAIVDPEEAAQLVHGLSSATLTGASWCAEDGRVDRPQSVIEALARDTTLR